MSITQIHNVTQLITNTGKRFLRAPMLASKGAYPGFLGLARANIRNPMVELFVDVNRLLRNQEGPTQITMGKEKSQQIF